MNHDIIRPINITEANDLIVKQIAIDDKSIHIIRERLKDFITRTSYIEINDYRSVDKVVIYDKNNNGKRESIKFDVFQLRDRYYIIFEHIHHGRPVQSYGNGIILTGQDDVEIKIYLVDNYDGLDEFFKQFI